MNNSNEIRIIAHTSDLLVIDKPPGVLSVPSRMGPKDERPVVRNLLENQGVRDRLYPVHRLDFEVSGLLVFAKTPKAQRELSALFESRKAKKTYEAITELGLDKAFPEKNQIQNWTHLLVRGKKRSFEAPHGQEAITEALFKREIRWKDLSEKWKALAQESQMGKLMLWELRPQTGRPHQLRVQCALKGMPILGDAKYGSRLSGGGLGIGLRAVKIALGDFGEFETGGVLTY